MTSLPNWLDAAPTDLRLHSPQVELCWSQGTRQLSGRLGASRLELELDGPVFIKVGRSRRVAPRLLRWWRKDTHLLHVELRGDMGAAHLFAEVRDASLLAGLPWLEGHGEEVDASGLMSLCGALRALPEVELASWPPEAAVDPRERSARGLVCEAVVAAPTITARTQGAPRGRLLAWARAFGRLLWGLFICLMGLGFTTTFLVLDTDYPGWATGPLAGIVVALLSLAVEESSGRTARVGLFFLPVYGLVFALVMPSLTLHGPYASTVADEDGPVVVKSARFVGARVAVELEGLALDEAGKVALAVAPLVPEDWDGVMEPAMWAVCDGSNGSVQSCRDGWRAPQGTLFVGEAIGFARYSEQRWLEASHLASLRAIERNSEALSAAQHKVAEMTAKRQVQLPSGTPTAFFALSPSDVSEGDIWWRRVLFGLFVLALMAAWIFLGWERPNLRNRRKSK